MKTIIYILIIFLSKNSFSNQGEVINLHENKSLDQLVLDQLEEKQVIINDNLEDINQEPINENTNYETVNSEEENILESEVIIDQSFVNILTPQNANTILNNAKNINSNALNREFHSLLTNLNLDYSNESDTKIFYEIINYFYNTGNISKSYSIIKSKDIINDQNINFYNFVEINYLLSTFQLENACNFKDQIDLKLNSKSNFIDKMEIFCLILEDKISEAELLFSLMQETSQNVDYNYEQLFFYLTDSLSNNDKEQYNFSNNIDPNLLFLYSAMARIAELPLTEKFLNVDPINMSIPIILNKASPIDLRIKAAHESFRNETISVESLAALYQSVDFASKDLDNPETTIENLSGNIDLLMAFYFQLINIQIFPSERLDAIINFWDFAKINNLEKIAYSLSNKIIDSIEISSDYLMYSTQISTSYIYNGNYEKALKWIEFYENTNGTDISSASVKLLLELYSSKDVNLLINIITDNLDALSVSDNKYNEELLFILSNTIQENELLKLSEDFNLINDERLMPSIFISENIQEAINSGDENKFLIYSIVSINNKNWIEIHPEHLKLLLVGFKKYKNGSLLTNIVLEIFENYKIL